MKFQPEALETSPEYGHRPPCIIFSLEEQDKVIRVANEPRPFCKPRSQDVHDPTVEHLVEKNVCEQR